MSYKIIHIPIKKSSNDVKSFVVVFIHLQLTVGRVVECSRDHVRLLDDLLNDTTLAQKKVASSIFPVTKILTIENHKIYYTFFHVAFGSQTLLKPTSDQTGSDTN
jgi:hypothetical protein